MLQGDSKQVCQCTTTMFRDEPDEEQRLLKAEMVVVAVAKAYCCNEIDLDELYKYRDEQVKIVAAIHVSAPNATIADTVLDETVPEEELPERAIANVVDVVVPAPKKRKLLNARSNTSRRSSKTVATSSSSSFEDLPF